VGGPAPHPVGADRQVVRRWVACRGWPCSCAARAAYGRSCPYETPLSCVCLGCSGGWDRPVSHARGGGPASTCGGQRVARPPAWRGRRRRRHTEHGPGPVDDIRRARRRSVSGPAGRVPGQTGWREARVVGSITASADRQSRPQRSVVAPRGPLPVQRFAHLLTGLGDAPERLLQHRICGWVVGNPVGRLPRRRHQR